LLQVMVTVNRLCGAPLAAMVAHGGGHMGMDGVRECSGVTVGESVEEVM